LAPSARILGISPPNSADTNNASDFLYRLQL
jgi:hypothetical protein